MHEPRSTGTHGPSAHALSALRAALDNTADSNHNWQQQQQQPQQQPQQPQQPQQQHYASHAGRSRRDHSPWSHNGNARHPHNEQLPERMSTSPMRASYGSTPLHNSTSGSPLRATIGGHADLQRLEVARHASPVKAQRSAAPPMAYRAPSPQARTEMRHNFNAEAGDSGDPIPHAPPDILAAPHSTPTLGISRELPSIGPEVDNGPLGIVFSHTCTPTLNGDSIFNMHKVTKVLPGSIADRCGLISDDLLLRVNEISVDTLSAPDLRFHFGQLTGTRTLSIDVMRMVSQEGSKSTTQRAQVILTRVKSPAATRALPDYLTLGSDADANVIPRSSRHETGAYGAHAPPSSPQVDSSSAPGILPGGRTSSVEKDPIIQEFNQGLRASITSRTENQNTQIPRLRANQEDDSEAFSDYAPHQVVVEPDTAGSAHSRKDLAVDVGHASLLSTPVNASQGGSVRSAALPWTDGQKVNGSGAVGLDESLVCSSVSTPVLACAFSRSFTRKVTGGWLQ